MCHGHHEHTGSEHAGAQEHGRRHGRGRRGRGFPSRTQLVERLQGYQQHLEAELANTRDLLNRLGDAPEHPDAI